MLFPTRPAAVIIIILMIVVVDGDKRGPIITITATTIITTAPVANRKKERRESRERGLNHFQWLSKQQSFCDDGGDLHFSQSIAAAKAVMRERPLPQTDPGECEEERKRKEGLGRR